MSMTSDQNVDKQCRCEQYTCSAGSVTGLHHASVLTCREHVVCAQHAMHEDQDPVEMRAQSRGRVHNQTFNIHFKLSCTCSSVQVTAPLQDTHVFWSSTCTGARHAGSKPNESLPLSCPTRAGLLPFCHCVQCKDAAQHTRWPEAPGQGVAPGLRALELSRLACRFRSLASVLLEAGPCGLCAAGRVGVGI